MLLRRFLLLLLATMSAASVVCGEEPESLAHWGFDGIGGGAFVGASGGTIIGTTDGDFLQPGLYGKAAFFDNAKGYVKASHSEAVSLDDDFTIVCVIKPFNVGGFRTILWKGDRTVTPEAINYCVDLRDGKVEFKTKDAEGKWVVYSTEPAVEPHHWYLLMLSYTGGAVSIWVNGQEEQVHVSEDGARGRVLVENDADAVIGAGANRHEVLYGFHGLIDEVRILGGARRGFSDGELDDWEARLAAYDGKVRAFEVEGLADWLREVRAQLRESEDLARAAEIDGALSGLRAIAGEEFAASLNQTRTRIKELAFRAAFKGAASGEEPEFLVHAMGTWERVVERPGWLRGLRALQSDVELEAARNEAEGFQVLLIGNPDSDVEGVAAEFDGVHHGGNTIGVEHIEWGWLKSIRTETPDIPVDFTGPIPDAIMEGRQKVDVPRGGFTTLHFRIRVPESATPGQYEGGVEIASADTRVRIPVRLRVHSFALPQRPSLRMAFSFFESYSRDWYGWKSVTPERRRYLQEFLLSYRIPLNNIYGKEYVNPPLDALEAVKDRANFATSRYTAGDVWAADDLTALVARYKEALDATERAGLAPHFYVYTYDEVAYNKQGIPGARQFTEGLRGAWPGVKLMQTSFPEPEIRDLFNVWVPIFRDFADAENLAVLDELRERGDEIWWYAADSPRHPCPNFFLDYPPFDCRIVGTLSYLYDVTGVLYWSINREWKTNLDIRERWPQAEWKPYIFHIRHGTRKYKNGMGNLVYPGRDGQLYPSLRLENLRDGVEDFEYLKLLEDGVERLREQGDAPELLEDAEALLAVPEAVATAVDAYSSDAAHLLGYRHRVAVMLDRVQACLAATPGKE